MTRKMTRLEKHQPIGYTYNAAMHCATCGDKVGAWNPFQFDREGNIPLPVYRWHEIDPDAACDTCGKPIA